MFIDKVQAVENKFIDLEQRISDPSVIARQDEWQKLTKEHASLAPIIETFRKYKDVSATIADDKEIIADGSDAELTAMAKEELSELMKEQEALEEELHVLMLPKDPNDDKNVIMEIRGGAACIRSTLKSKRAGRQVLSVPTLPNWAAIRKLSFPLRVTVYTASSNTNRVYIAYNVCLLRSRAAVFIHRRRR